LAQAYKKLCSIEGKQDFLRAFVMILRVMQYVPSSPLWPENFKNIHQSGVGA